MLECVQPHMILTRWYIVMVLGKPHPVYSDYVGFRDGTIKHIRRGFLKGFRSKAGYVTVSIGSKPNCVTTGLHRFIWECWHGKIDDRKMQVDHINRIRCDNRLVNLQLLTQQEHAAKTSLVRRRKVCLDLEAIPEEVWRDIPNSKWQVSDHGRLKTVSGRITTGRVGAYGYMIVGIGSKDHRVHRLVATAFCLPPAWDQLFVDHIDRDISNNKATNLRWVTPKENAANSCQPSKQVLAWKGGVKLVFPSIAAASKHTRHGRTYIRLLCAGKKPVHSTAWHFK